ncbi:MAG TPA: aminotransferase class V-fold PLP-dependent enzyme [Alphaproteobacteria bacterium]|nr:aminotransferase [Rhodospirillaceae bacterium]HRJ66112.1 aminotransferase class V-fold PLP-dependent enzyme [Alphaproteobacteria bacterium]
MRPDIKQDFSRFLNAVPGRLHMAAHSHHYWPDVTLDAQIQAWTDAALHADSKWDHVFGHLMPDVRRGLAKMLNLSSPDTLVFAQNTHEFVLRLLSCFAPDKPVRILTTDSEFYSFDRQVKRLEEDGLVTVTRIPSVPFDSFNTRFSDAAAKGDADIVFVSQVFFNSGFQVTPLESIVSAVSDENTFVVIDGYHGFMAVPMDLSRIHARAFYIGGGYKYAMSGEGACFMHCPPDYGGRPRNTGWFAGFGALPDGAKNTVAYGADASRFAGATADVSGLYRLRAVMAWLEQKQITVADIHAHAHRLQAQFVAGLPALKHDALKPENLLVSVDEKRRGNFLTFRTPDAADICECLRRNNVITDRRGDCLRFGFGPYHDAEDIRYLLEVIGNHVC